MPSYVKLLDEFLSNTEKETLAKDYNSDDREYTASVDQKAHIAYDFLHGSLLPMLKNNFDLLLENPIQIIGSGTQGFVVAFQTLNASKGFEKLAKQTSRLRGPFGHAPQPIVVKVQYIPKASSYAEKRMLREEYIMEYLNNSANVNASASEPSTIVRNAIPKLYFGCTISFSDIAFFRLTFMEAINPVEYMTLERIMLWQPTSITDKLYNNIEKIVKALWRLGVSHNDLSIRNIMARHDGDVKLLDFGLSNIFNVDLSKSSNATIQDDYEALFARNSKEEQRGSNVVKLRELCALLQKCSPHENNIAQPCQSGSSS